jgi:hypothetical protein
MLLWQAVGNAKTIKNENIGDFILHYIVYAVKLGYFIL